MTRKIRTVLWLLLLLTLTTPQLISAKETHQEVWLRGSVTLPLTKNFSIENEFQHRRQNAFDKSNPFNKNYVYFYKLWLKYKLNKNVSFLVLPFSYHSNYALIRSVADESKKPDKEYRFALGVHLNNQLGKNFYLQGRSLLEYRVLEKDRKDVVRLRQRLGLKYNLSKKVWLSVSDELIFNAVGKPANQFFDQNRASAGIGFSPAKGLNVNTSYTFLSRLPGGESERIRENVLTIDLNYTIPQIKRKSKTSAS